MGFLSRLHQPRRLASAPGPLNPFWYGPARDGVSGFLAPTNPEQALTLSALWRGVTFLSTNLASLPLVTYERLQDGGKQRATGHELYNVLRWQPNLWQTAQEYWEMLMGHCLLRGNAYAEIVRGPRGFADQLVPRHPDRVTVTRLPTGRLQYRLLEADGTVRFLTQDEVFHVRGFSSDGLTGLSLISYGAGSFGSAMAQEHYARSFFRQGATAAIAAIHPGVLGEEGQKNLRASINAYATGMQNAHGLLVLEEAMSIQAIGISPQDSQLLASREHTVREVARWLGLPTHILADVGKAPTYASIEMFGLELVIYAFRPWAVRIEQAIRRDLILDPDRYFSEFLLDALMRGDSKARANYYHFGILDGWLHRNEARERENLNPGGPELDRFLEPQNMRTAGAVSEYSPDQAADETPGAAQQARLAGRPNVRATILALELAGSVVRKEKAAVARAAQRCAKDGEAWSRWLREFYADHAVFVAEKLKLPGQVAREYAARQGTLLERGGVAIMDDWDHTVAAELAQLALDGGTHAGAFSTMVLAPQITVHAPTAPTAAIHLDAPITVQLPAAAATTKTVRRNGAGHITAIIETPVETRR